MCESLPPVDFFDHLHSPVTRGMSPAQALAYARDKVSLSSPAASSASVCSVTAPAVAPQGGKPLALSDCFLCPFDPTWPDDAVVGYEWSAYRQLEHWQDLERSLYPKRSDFPDLYFSVARYSSFLEDHAFAAFQELKRRGLDSMVPVPFI